MPAGDLHGLHSPLLTEGDQADQGRPEYLTQVRAKMSKGCKSWEEPRGIGNNELETRLGHAEASIRGSGKTQHESAFRSPESLALIQGHRAKRARASFWKLWV